MDVNATAINISMKEIPLLELAINRFILYPPIQINTKFFVSPTPSWSKTTQEQKRPAKEPSLANLMNILTYFCVNDHSFMTRSQKVVDTELNERDGFGSICAWPSAGLRD